MKKYTELIRKKRKEKKISQNQLAKKVGISQAHMNSLEKETAKPSLKLILKIYRELEIKIIDKNKTDEEIITDILNITEEEDDQ